VKLYRIGNKVVSLEKLTDAIAAILEDRESGSTQLEAAVTHGVQRSFVSFLESLGEVRRGPRVALVGFPVANCDEVRAAAERHALDLVLVMSQDQRESIESGPAYDIFNQLLETLAALRDFDVVILLASDWRIKTVEHILGTEVVGLPLGTSPLRHDVTVDISQLDEVLDAVMAARKKRKPGSGRVGSALRDAAGEIAGRWTPSKK